MQTALPSASSHAQTWITLRRGSSQVLPAILDDDEESGSTSCDAPDSLGPANELLTSSGEDQWSVGNDRGADSGDQGFLELNPLPPVGLYSSGGLSGTIATLPFEQSHQDAAPTTGSLSAHQIWEAAQDADPRPNRPVQGQGQQQQQQRRLMPALPAAFSFSKTPQPKRTPAPRLTALVVDVARAAAVVEANLGSRAYGKDNRVGDRRAISTTEGTLGPAPLRPSPAASVTPGLNNNNLLTHDQPSKYSQQQQPALRRERTRSLGRSRSVAFEGASLPLPRPIATMRGLVPPGAGAGPGTGLESASPGGAAISGSGNGSARVSSVLEFRAHNLPHSAPPHQQHQHQHQHLQQAQALAQAEVPSQQPGPLSLGSLLNPGPRRLRTTSQGSLRAGLQPSLQSQMTVGVDANSCQLQHQQQQQQQQQSCWGLASAGHGIAASASTTPLAPAAPAIRPQPLASLSRPPAAAVAADRDDLDGRDGDHHTERDWLQSLPSLSSMLTAQQETTLTLSQSQQHQQQEQNQQQRLLCGGSLDASIAPSPNISPQRIQPQHQDHQRPLSMAVSAPLLRLPETAPAAAAATDQQALLPPSSRHQPLLNRIMPGRVVGTAGGPRLGRGRPAVPPLVRGLQLPELKSVISGPPTAAAAAATAATAAAAIEPPQPPSTSAAAAMEPGEVHILSAGVLAQAAGGPSSVEVPPAPDIVLRPPRWLKPSAFQVTEQLRSGRLQELADKLATVSCPTLFDLGGCEFSGSFATATVVGASVNSGLGTGGVKGPVELGPVAAAAAAATAALGAVASSPTAQRHQNVRSGPRAGDDNLSARTRYLRNIPGPSSGLQVLAIPPGQHITLHNATLLLTADQYIFIGPGASLTLKGVEVMGCSREAARQSAAMRRRALLMAAAAAAAAASPSVQAAAAAPAVAGVMSTASTGYTKLVRRSSSPGRTTRESGMYGVGSTARRISFGDNAADGSSGSAGMGSGIGGVGPLGLSTIRRRAMSTVGGSPFVLSIPLPGQDGTGTALAAHELVDPSEYVDHHALIEVVGGYARISNCRLWPGRCQLALCVSDSGGCSLSCSMAGACCAAGQKSCLVSEQTTYEGSTAGCVSALDGARLGLTDCVMRYNDGAEVSGEGSDGTAVLGGCDIGMEARGSGTLAVLANCDVTNGGITAALGARLFLQSTRVSDARGHGLLACDPGTTLYARDCRVDDSGRSAVVACEGATVRIADATLAGNAGSGAVVLPFSHSIDVIGDGEGDADDADGSKAAVAADDASELALTPPISPPMSRASLTLLRCDVSTNAGHGASVTGGGFLVVSDSVLYNNLGCGLTATGLGSMLSAVGSRLIRNDAQGVRVARGAGVVLARCCATGNSRDGVAVEGAGSHAHLTRCECRENRESGLCVTGSAAVELSYSRLAANQHDGLAVGGTGSTAVAHGCVLNGNVAKGAVVCMGGSAEMTECAVHCNGSKSVQVSDEDSRLVLGCACSMDRQAVAINGGTLVHPQL